jgi:hypothetical protein
MTFLLAWVAVFALSSLFWAWVLFWGGAERLEGSFLSHFLVHSFAPRWSTEGIKLFAALTWLLEALGLAVAVVVPAVRSLG